MILIIKYLATASLIITAAVAVYKKDNPVQVTTAAVHQTKKDRQDQRDQVIEAYIAEYRKELNVMREKEKAIKKENTQLDIELVNAEADNSNTAEAGMRASFQEGINATLKERNRKVLSDIQSNINRLHVKYSTIISDMGYDKTELEGLMCKEEEVARRICSN